MLERTVAKFPLSEEAWSSYVRYLKKQVNKLRHSKEVKHDDVVAVCRRSLRNLPHSAGRWLHLARALERSAPADKVRDEVYALLEHKPLMNVPQEYAKIITGLLDFERRQFGLQETNTSGLAALVSLAVDQCKKVAPDFVLPVISYATQIHMEELADPATVIKLCEGGLTQEKARLTAAKADSADSAHPVATAWGEYTRFLIRYQQPGGKIAMAWRRSQTEGHRRSKVYFDHQWLEWESQCGVDVGRVEDLVDEYETLCLEQVRHSMRAANPSNQEQYVESDGNHVDTAQPAEFPLDRPSADTTIKSSAQDVMATDAINPSNKRKRPDEDGEGDTAAKRPKPSPCKVMIMPIEQPESCM